MSIVKLPQMERQRVEELLKNQVLCRIAFKGEEYPYIAPFQYAYLDGNLYFHFTRYGKKIALITKDNRVAVEIESYESDLSQYSFVVFRGELEEVKDNKEKIKALARMAEIGSQRLSTNFLAAHGLDKSDGWHALPAEKSLAIMKLTNVNETVALGSPKS
ncbi:MAG: pyridoxamine 5'-phosphate oxidase family protein [Candidatus Hermodarchaeota archaeon]|nr:pyridoxamine 5'-phosphate oxidase family protein [Candidatus Hermodarchaeota archaeon]